MHTAFNETQRTTITALCEELSRQLGRTVAADYGTSDAAQEHDAFLYVEGRQDARGYPRPLVTIIGGPRVNGFAVMAPSGASIAHDVDFDRAIQVARAKAKGQHRMKRRATGSRPGSGEAA